MGRREFFEEERLKKLLHIFSITLILSVVAFLTIFVMYSKRMRNESARNLESLGKINDIVSNEDLEVTSYSKDLSFSEATNTNSTTEKNNTSNVNKSRNIIDKTPVEAIVKNDTTDNNDTIQNEKNDEPEKELSFGAPVSGEITKDYAIDTLIYSNTLEEWTTHPGIDIKADKTTIVTASEEGIVESIKNDPRYGLTVTISHRDGFKTVYSNLLTTEFITVNEEVEKGQTIGTIGESASFEVADEAHLHFEMYKDNSLVNPTIYMK